jgi:hypothetical protein
MAGGRREGSWNIRNAATGRKRSVRQLSPAAIRASRGTPRSEGKRADRFKPRCGWTGRQPAGSAQARFRLHGAGQSQPIFRSAKWSRACARETALRCNIVPPPPAAIKLQKIRASALGQGAPFLGDLLERMCGLPFRHGKALSGRCSRCGLVLGARKQQPTAHCCPLCRTTQRITASIIARFHRKRGASSERR